MAEDAVGEAVARALRAWTISGSPPNPEAWLVQTAKRVALDALRRDRRLHPLALAEHWSAEVVPTDGLNEDELRMLYLCAHPALPPEARLVLLLSAIAGFRAKEIGRALLISEVAATKRLTRAKELLLEKGAKFELPGPTELASRHADVLRALYLMFNEGYAGLEEDRVDLAHEAILLTDRLVRTELGDRPDTHALLALMLVQASRFEERESGKTLEEQDRSRWDQALIARGQAHFAKSLAGETLSEYHPQAFIALCHAEAPSWEATDWAAIHRAYDDLWEISPSPVVRLNRAVARIMDGLDPDLGDVSRLQDYAPYWAFLGWWAERRGEDGREFYRQALERTSNERDRALLLARAGGQTPG